MFDSRELVRSALGFFGVRDSRYSFIVRLPKALAFMLQVSLESSTCEEANSSEWFEPILTSSGGWEDNFALERVLFPVEAVGFLEPFNFDEMNRKGQKR